MLQAESPRPLQIAAFSAALVALTFLLQGRIEFTYSDEGYLWYGAVRTLAGEIPMLDFQAYDPGRYYWSAFWMMFLGEGVLALRASVALMQWLGVFCGLLAISRSIRSWRMLVPIGCLLIVWMSPRYYRLFEASASLIALYFAVYLIERPSLQRHFAVGVFTGLVAFFGRNLGVYSVATFAPLILFIWARLDRADLSRRLASWSVGIGIGYLPMLIMLALVPGFFESMVSSVMELFDRETSNVPLPIPWPWLVDYAHLSAQRGVQAFSLGVLFLWMPLLYGAAAWIVLRSSAVELRSRSVLLGALAVGAVYSHYAFARADLEHLLVPMPLAFLSLTAIPFDLVGKRGGHLRRALLLVFTSLTLLLAGTTSPLYLKAMAPPGSLVEYEVGGSKLWISASGAKLIEAVERIEREIVPEDEGFLIAPFWPGFYALLGRESPLHEIYFLLPHSAQREALAIEELERKTVNWVLLGNVSLQLESTSPFRLTHPLLWDHLRTDYRAVKVEGLPKRFSLWERIEPLVAKAEGLDRS